MRIVEALVVAGALLSTVADAQRPNDSDPTVPLEYDYCPGLVPATLPHLYRTVMRLYYVSEMSAQKRGKTTHPSWCYELRLSDADCSVFQDSAESFGERDDAFTKQDSAIRRADRAQHPELHGALSESARKETDAIYSKREAELIQQVATLRARLAPKQVTSLDKTITEWYLRHTTIPANAPRATTPCEKPGESSAELGK